MLLKLYLGGYQCNMPTLDFHNILGHEVPTRAKKLDQFIDSIAFETSYLACYISNQII